IAKTLQRLTNKYPSITFTILSGNADDIKWKIDNGLVDVGFLLEPTSTEKYNVEKIGFPERWMMLTQSDSELAELDEV
ncbi:LysR substrate-binding domain-containing protein, partial [Klebsiella pneumoniae]